MSGGSGRGGSAAAAEARAICRAGRALYRFRLVAGRAGNLSLRLPGGGLLATPRGSHLGRLLPEDLVQLDAGILADDSATDLPDDDSLERATSELPFHLAAYRAGPKVGAVVHVHGPALTGAGIRGLDPGERLPEISAALGGIALVPFRPSGSGELGRAVGEAVREGAGVLLLRHHGAVTVGSDLDEAVGRAELGELAAYAVLLAEATSLDLDLGHLAALHAAAARRRARPAR